MRLSATNMPSMPPSSLRTPTRLLLASIHDVSPRFERETDILAELLARKLNGPRFAMLVVPDHWGNSPLSQAPAFQRRLREWSDSGVEMFVHGWFHRDLATHSGFARLKARTMTASEGEFLGLSEDAAGQRMADGKSLIEDIIGRAAAGFVAPAWLYGKGARHALAASGFALAEDHLRVWQPATGQVVARGPVVTWASRSRSRQLGSLAFAGLARHALQRMKVARVAVHPGDAAVPELLSSIENTLEVFGERRLAARYADLLR